MYCIAMLRGQWREADEIARQMTAGADLFAKFVGWYSRAQVSLTYGRAAEAADRLQQALRDSRPPMTSVAHIVIGRLQLDRGELSKAVAAGEHGRREGRGDPAEWGAVALLAEALAASGQTAAEERLSELRAAADTLAVPELRRSAHLTEGNMALGRGDARAAIDAITKAQATLRPRSATGPPSLHVPIWYGLAQAHLAAGDRAAAAAWFQRILDSRVERVHFPLETVRSHYFLGRIAERNGDRERAREHYLRFVGYWKDGDIDRERVAEARAKLR
jgi:tetratricopeptide (TPR) repeat protein